MTDSGSVGRIRLLPLIRARIKLDCGHKNFNSIVNGNINIQNVFDSLRKPMIKTAGWFSAIVMPMIHAATMCGGTYLMFD